MDSLLHVTDAWPHGKSARKNCGGHKAMLLFCDHFGGPNDVYCLHNQSEMKLQNLMYAGERKNWNFERFVTAHKEQHIILEVSNDHGYNGLDNSNKVTRLMDGVKVGSLNTVKAMILANSNVCKGFDNCFTLYNELLKLFNSTPSETRRVLKVIFGVNGGSGGKKSKDHYYTMTSISRYLVTRKGNSIKSARNAALTHERGDHLNQSPTFGS